MDLFVLRKINWKFSRLISSNFIAFSNIVQKFSFKFSWTFQFFRYQSPLKLCIWIIKQHSCEYFMSKQTVRGFTIISYKRLLHSLSKPRGLENIFSTLRKKRFERTQRHRKKPVKFSFHVTSCTAGGEFSSFSFQLFSFALCVEWKI